MYAYEVQIQISLSYRLTSDVCMMNWMRSFRSWGLQFLSDEGEVTHSVTRRRPPVRPLHHEFKTWWQTIPILSDGGVWRWKIRRRKAILEFIDTCYQTYLQIFAFGHMVISSSLNLAGEQVGRSPRCFCYIVSMRASHLVGKGSRNLENQASWVSLDMKLISSVDLISSSCEENQPASDLKNNQAKRRMVVD
jgi:hypothetical protein